MKQKLLVGLSWLFLFSLSTQAQSLFGEVVSILENNGCTNGYCHGGSAGGLDLSGSNGDIYNNLVGITPQNETAMMKGDLLVAPGYPERSFLYRKVNKGAYHDSELTSGEMDDMPPNDTELSARDKEVIRQWIYFGAKQSGNLMGADNFQAMEDYFADGGIDPVERPEAPPEGEGFQVHLGPIFLPPGEETEYLKKFELRLGENTEVNRIELFMSDFSHHFILYKFGDVNEAANMAEGFRSLFSQPQSAEFVTIWQDNLNYTLPEGTAYFWDENDVLDLNYHIKNYNQSVPLAANLYFNVYTQEEGTAIKEMFSALLLNFNIYIPNNSTDVTFDYYTTLPFNINLWMMTPHTHQYGVDYDVFLENENGLQLFEGLYNTNYTAYTGEYDYAHPPVRYFDNFIELPSGSTLLNQATFNNDGPEPVSFGLTTDDEMMITAIQYTVGDNHQEPAQINEINAVYCESDPPVELFANYESGVVGNGVIWNQFHPDKAGIGTHIIIIDCCDENTQTELEIEVIPGIENPTVIENEGVLSVEAVDDLTYQWYLDGEAIEGATEVTYEPMVMGSYYVVASSEACTAQSLSVMVEDMTSIETVTGVEKINVFPNPFEGQTQLKYDLKETANVVLEIYNITGQRIRTIANGRQQAGQYNYNIDLSDEAAGVYLLQLNVDGQLLTKKLTAQ